MKKKNDVSDKSNMAKDATSLVKAVGSRSPTHHLQKADVIAPPP